MRWTSPTPERTSMSRISNSRRAPTAPSTVCLAPVERCTSKPISIRRSMTFCTCSSVAASCMATIMVLCAGPVSRVTLQTSLCSDHPINGITRSPDGSSIVYFHIKLCFPVGDLLLRHNLHLLNIPHHVNNAFKYLAQFTVRKRPAVGLPDILKDDFFPVRLIDGHIGIALQLPNFLRCTGTLIQDFHQTKVQFIDFSAPVRDCHIRPNPN